MHAHKFEADFFAAIGAISWTITQAHESTTRE
jgi:hypothetical protein